MTMKILVRECCHQPEEKNYLAESEVRHMSKEQLRAMIAWLEIERQTQERLTEIRRELAKLAVSEQDVMF